MSWRIEVKSNAEKYYLKLSKTDRKRIKEALSELTTQNHPLDHPDVKALTGQLHGDYRLRIGDYRALFQINLETKSILVHTLLPRGDVYKKKS